MKPRNLHIAISSFAALAGVTIAAYQAFGPSAPPVLPVQVTVALDQPAQTEEVALKQDGGPSLATDAVALEREASFSAALKDGSEQRYDFGKLFDDDGKTSLVIEPPDSELNVLVSFDMQRSFPVTAIRYTPPPGADPTTLATNLDVMVLPEGQIEATGRPVMSYTLQQSRDSQTFAIPGHAVGKAVWLRISGGPQDKPVRVGDFSILREQLAP
ncbi:MAG: hypothetical protein U1F47_08965 [Hyphomicrobiales bacterium]